MCHVLSCAQVARQGPAQHPPSTGMVLPWILSAQPAKYLAASNGERVDGRSNAPTPGLAEKWSHDAQQKDESQQTATPESLLT